MAVRSLYIHIPYCEAKCPYCDFNSIAGRNDEFSAYIDALLLECSWLPAGPYETIFIGGGTPTILPAELLQKFLTGVREHIELAPDYEWTCEANPGSVDSEKFSLLASHGVNRVSLGVQSTQPHHLQFLGRVHSRDEAFNAIAMANSLFPRVSADLIIGLPQQTLDEMQQDLTLYHEFGLTHASVYHLTIEPGTEFAAKYQRGLLQQRDQDSSGDFLDAARSQLQDYGLAAYETSNFARPGQECRHNLAYWQQYDYHAIGAGAVSTIGADRITREKHPAHYITKLQAGEAPVWRHEHLSAVDRIREAWMLGLRLQQGVSPQRLCELGDDESRWRLALQQQIDLGNVTEAGGFIALTQAGRWLQDSVTVSLMP